MSSPAGSLVGAGSGKCLDATSSANGAGVQISDCNGSAAQQWTGH
jgi:hypothetical protein